MNFSGKTALITGASSGIGVGFAHACAREGCRLVLTARREDRLLALREELGQKYGTNVTCIPANLDQKNGVKDLINRITELDINVDILINNAGFGYSGPFIEADADVYRSMIDVNITALTELTHAFLPAMAERRYGGILNVASMAGMQAMPYFAVYAATKSYVIHMTEALWKEHQHSGVHIVALCPGPVDTEFFEVSGYDPSNGSVARSIQSVAEVVNAGILALQRNTMLAPTSRLLRILTVLQRFVPRKLGLSVLATQMKASARKV